MGCAREGWNALALEGFLAEAQTLRSLVGVSIEDWVVLQRNTFDVHANDVPHVAQTLYLQKATGRYFHKIFGQTIRDGQLDAPLGLRDLTQDIFQHSRVCQGFDDDIKVEPGIDLVPGFHPYKRKVDPNCLKLFKDRSNQATLCSYCTQAIHVDADPLSLHFSPQYKVEESPNEVPLMDIAVQEPSLWPDDSLEDDGSDLDGENGNDNPEDSNYEDENIPLHSKRPKMNGDLEPALSTLGKDNRLEEKSVTTRRKQVRRIQCGHCDKSFSSQVGYHKHRTLLKRISSECTMCGEKYDSLPKLAKHIEMGHNLLSNAALKLYLWAPEEVNTMKKVQACSICDMYVNGNVMLHRHRALYHELGDFKCADCDQFQLTYYHLVLHNYNHHYRPTPYLEPSSDDLDRVEHEDGRIELVRNRHACPKCEKSYKCDGLWGVHMKNKHFWSVFTCEQCDEICHYLQDFHAHVNNFHSDKPEIKCPNCSEVFNLKGDPKCFDTHFPACVRQLNRKIEKPPLQCEICGKSYSTRYMLQCHLDSHEGLEKYICGKCDYGTNLKAVFADHQKFHLRAEGQTQDEDGNDLFYHCAQCPKKYSQKMSLKRHIKQAHEGVKLECRCNVCDLTFSNKTKLYIHKRMVHGFVSTRSRSGRQKL